MLQKIMSLYVRLRNRWMGFYAHRVLHRRHIEPRQTPAVDLLKYAGVWAGDDLEDCLADALQARAEALF